MTELSYSIPIVYRAHQRLWEKNRLSLKFQMEEAKKRLEQMESLESQTLNTMLPNTVVRELVLDNA